MSAKRKGPISHIARPLRDGSSQHWVLQYAISGPDGLGQWILNHYKYVQSAYVTAIRAGYPSDCVVWLMPVTNSVEDPPNGAVPSGRSEDHQ